MFPATAAEPPPAYEIENPKMHISSGGSHGTWNGTPSDTGTDGVDGEFEITTGGIRYSWAELEDIDDYDFVEVFYTASDVADVVYKHYNSSSDYAHTGSISTGSGSIKFVMREATGAGFAIQKWQAGNPSVTTKITITKLVFTKGTRYNITFSLGALEGTAYGGSDSVPTSPAYVLDGAVFGPLPAVSWTPNRFNGWTNGAAAVTATTVVDSSFNNAVITAQWLPPKTVPPINVTFSSVDELTGYSAVPTLSGNGYTITPSQGNGYAWVKFSVDFGNGNTISDYDKLTCTIEGSGTDFTYKSIYLVAGVSIASGTNITGAATNPLVINTISDWNYGSGSASLTLTIDKSKTTALTAQELEIIILPNAPASAIYTITNIQFSQN